jgi:uncharacterized membrane protein
MLRAIKVDESRVSSMRIAEYCYLTIIIVSCAGAFVGLSASSMWFDELFTAYFADPVISSVGELVGRAAEDVHPPGYYLLVWAVNRTIGGDFAVVTRGLSAVLSIIAVAVLYHAFPRPIGRFGRLFACAFATTSMLWYPYSQEARSYALGFVPATILLLLAFRILASFREGGARYF